MQIWKINDTLMGVPHGIMAYILDCCLKVNEFVLQLHYYNKFWSNLLEKRINPHSPCCGLNNITAVLLQEITNEGWYAIKSEQWSFDLLRVFNSFKFTKRINCARVCLIKTKFLFLQNLLYPIISPAYC